MKLSFVIPAYNEEAIIAKCLDTVQKEIAHTKASGVVVDTEVVVVNNASTDRTKEIAITFPSVRVVDEPTKGLVSARNAGFHATSGEFVANIDSDVLIPDGWLTTVIREFEKNDKLVALSGPFIYHDLSAFTRFWVKVFYICGWVLSATTQLLFRKGAMLQGGNFIIRRDAWLRAGGFDTSIIFYGEDTDVAKRLSRVGKVKWTFKLPVYTSGRRLKAEGVIYMSLKYTVNYFWVTFFGQPYTTTHIDIRPK